MIEVEMTRLNTTYPSLKMGVFSFDIEIKISR